MEGKCDNITWAPDSSVPETSATLGFAQVYKFPFLPLDLQ